MEWRHGVQRLKNYWKIQLDCTHLPNFWKKNFRPKIFIFGHRANDIATWTRRNGHGRLSRYSGSIWALGRQSQVNLFMECTNRWMVDLNFLFGIFSDQWMWILRLERQLKTIYKRLNVISSCRCVHHSRVVPTYHIAIVSLLLKSFVVPFNSTYNTCDMRYAVLV